MMVGATVDKVNFGMMMEELQKITGLSFKQIVRAQAKMILNHAVKHTPKASVAKIVERYYPHGLTFRKASGDNEISTLKESGITYPLADQEGHRWYYPNKIWRKIMRQTKESEKITTSCSAPLEFIGCAFILLQRCCAPYDFLPCHGLQRELVV